MNWQQENEGPKWMDALHSAEVQYGIPHNLLARIAYQESHFRKDIIDGAVKSSAGAVGMMQLIPRFFPGAGVDTNNDIKMAAVEIVRLYNHFQDWQVAVAAYNWGQGNIQHEYAKDANKYVLADMPKETQDYCTDICGDTGIGGSLIPSIGALA